MLFILWSLFTCPIVSVCSDPCVLIIQITKLCVLVGLLMLFEFVVTCCFLQDFFTFPVESAVAIIFLVESLHLLYCFGML